MITILHTKQAPNPIGPYNQGLKKNDFVITSGQIPIDTVSGEIPISIIEQTKLALEHIKSIVESSGLKINNIIKMTLYVINISDIEKINYVYKKFFLQHKSIFPARSCVEVSRLPKDVKIEIDAIAIK
ncbi:Rid family detoxifying hydrolase [Buchnera aphidicola]|nr:Rid family detoxifying hydrolase [Buchnera aphidicola]